VRYWPHAARESALTCALDACPPELLKKQTLIKFFADYFAAPATAAAAVDEVTIAQSVDAVSVDAASELAELLVHWHRDKRGMVLWMADGGVQVRCDDKCET
jgi:hypothetical protein